MSTIRYDVKDRIAWITLNRPEKRNAINLAMRKELQEAFEDVKFNPDVWVAVLTGEGNTFCSGKDIVDTSPEENRGILSNHEIHQYQMHIFKPIICAVNGGCYAQGCGFALNSDIIIMSEKATFGWPQGKRGISSVGGPSRGTHVIPYHVAMGYLMRAKAMSAADCLRWGIATEVVPHENLLPTAQRYAEEILECAPLAVRGMKEAARLAYDLPLEPRMQVAQYIVERVSMSEDKKEGIQAFKEKRKPVWRGR
jgi:enoyl-CoA hydratase/carnithine racemase